MSIKRPTSGTTTAKMARYAVVLVFLAFLGSQLIVTTTAARYDKMRQISARSQYNAYDDLYDMSRGLQQQTQGSCPGDPFPEVCNGTAQCQADCCFATSTCTSSANNNCKDASALFPPTPGDKMDNHNTNDVLRDGCFCDFSTPEYTSTNNTFLSKPNCTIQDSSSNDSKALRCWGIIGCDPSLALNSSEALCSSDNEGYCIVSQDTQ